MRAVLIAIAVLISGSLCGARQGELSAGLDLALQPDFVRRDLAMIQKDLGLDAGQSAILETLFNDYEAAFKAGTDEIRVQLSPLRQAMGGVDPELEQRREEIRDRAAALMEQMHQEREKLLESDKVDEAALQEWRARFEERARQLQQELQPLLDRPLTPENIQKTLEESADRISDWQNRKRHLQSEFLAKLQATLNDDQQALWPGLERRLTRSRTLAQGRVSGESVDLHHVLREIGITKAASDEALATLTNEYEVRLDEALRKRNSHLSNSLRPMVDALRASDGGAAEIMVDREIQLRVSVREINHRFADQIAAALPEQTRQSFKERYRARGYPRVFRTTAVQRMLNSAQELNQSDADLAQAIARLQQAYQQELSRANEQALQAVREHEPAELKRRLLQAWDATPDQEVAATDPLREAFERREALGQRYLRELKSLLTPEQFEKLPSGGAAGPTE